MITILSPAKKLDFETQIDSKLKKSKPIFTEEAQELISILQKKSIKKIGEMMHLSEKLADLNYQRYQKWSIKHTSKNARQNILTFNGAAYLALDAPTLSIDEILYSQNHLRILSGLYGLLKPLDLIQAHRLEMGTKLKTKRGTNLYQFWGNKITEKLKKDLKKNDNILVNLSSNEYFRSVKTKELNAKIITCHFKDMSKSGNYKSIMTFAKTARGLMARFIIQNKIKNPNHLTAFDSQGYFFSKKNSTDTEFIFLRG